MGRCFAGFSLALRTGGVPAFGLEKCHMAGFIAYYGILALFLFMLYTVKSERTPTLIGVIPAFIYLLLSNLPFPLQSVITGSAVTNFLALPVTNNYILPSLFFFAYLIKIIQTCLTHKDN